MLPGADGVLGAHKSEGADTIEDHMEDILEGNEDSGIFKFD